MTYDSIDTARAALEDAEDAYEQASERNAPHEVLDSLVQAIADAEQVYYRACDTWEPRDVSGVIGANGLVYSDADPGL